MSFISTYSAASIRAWQAIGSQWEFYKEVTKPQTNANTRFGYSCSTSKDGSYSVIGSVTARKLTVVSGSTFSTIDYLTPSYLNNLIGTSVAINNNGDTILGIDRTRGNATIFTRSVNTWSETQIISGFTNMGTQRGSSIDGAGNLIAIVHSPGGSNTQVSTYSNIANTWTLQANVVIANGGLAGDAPVQLNNAGNYMVTGDTNGDGGNGLASIFTLTGNTWSLQANVQSSTPNTNTLYGTAVSINNDANVIMVGSPGLDVGGNLNVGGVYVYTRSGNIWTQQQLITPLNNEPQQAFGDYISLDSTGDYAVIGAYAYDDGGGSTVNKGIIYFYANINGTWEETNSFLSPNPANTEFFGGSLSLSKDNNVLVVGAPGNDDPNTDVGAAYIYVNE